MYRGTLHQCEDQNVATCCAYSMQPQHRLLQALTSASSFLEISGQNSGGNISVDTWWEVRGARTVDGACVIAPRQRSCRNRCFQAVPEIWCWHQKMTSWKEIILTLFSLEGFSALWGFLRLMQCLARDTGAFILQRPCSGKGTGTAVPTFSNLPLQCLYLSFACKGERVGGWVATTGSLGSALRQHMPSASPGSSGGPGGFSGLIWTLNHASNCKAELAISPQTLKITAVIALVTRVDMKIWR